jgi:hypothetical protein
VKVRRDDDVAWHVAKYHAQRVCFAISKLLTSTEINTSYSALSMIIC